MKLNANVDGTSLCGYTEIKKTHTWNVVMNQKAIIIIIISSSMEELQSL